MNRFEILHDDRSLSCFPNQPSGWNIIEKMESASGCGTEEVDSRQAISTPLICIIQENAGKSNR